MCSEWYAAKSPCNLIGVCALTSRRNHILERELSLSVFSSFTWGNYYRRTEEMHCSPDGSQGDTLARPTTKPFFDALDKDWQLVDRQLGELGELG